MINPQQHQFEHHLQTQKDDYELIIARHLRFIDEVCFLRRVPLI